MKNIIINKNKKINSNLDNKNKQLNFMYQYNKKININKYNIKIHKHLQNKYYHKW